jgi:arginase
VWTWGQAQCESLANGGWLLGYPVLDAGDVPASIAETLHYGDSHSKFLREILQTCEQLARLVEETLEQSSLPIVLGGDHSIALGTLAGVAKHFGDRQEAVGLIWFDAHADFNTPQSSPSGNVHGMPLAASVGVGPEPLTHFCGIHPKVRPQNAVLVGVREIDAQEKELLASSAVRVFTMRDIDERGMRSVVEEATVARCRPPVSQFRGIWTSSIQLLHRGWGRR